jgi:hypothetical protein
MPNDRWIREALKLIQRFTTLLIRRHDQPRPHRHVQSVSVAGLVTIARLSLKDELVATDREPDFRRQPINRQ